VQTATATHTTTLASTTISATATPATLAKTASLMPVLLSRVNMAALASIATYPMSTSATVPQDTRAVTANPSTTVQIARACMDIATTTTLATASPTTAPATTAPPANTVIPCQSTTANHSRVSMAARVMKTPIGVPTTATALQPTMELVANFPTLALVGRAMPMALATT